MKRTIISLLVAGLFAGSATAALAQNVTADDGDKAGPTSAAAPKDEKEMTNPMHEDNAMGKDMHDKMTDKDMHDKRAAAFQKADKDHNGTLTPKEAKGMRGIGKNFKAIDTDKDGTVSLVEVDAYMAVHDKTSMK